MFYCSSSISLSSLLILPVTLSRKGEIQGYEGLCPGGDSFYGTDSKSEPRPLMPNLYSRAFWKVEMWWRCNVFHN